MPRVAEVLPRMHREQKKSFDCIGRAFCDQNLSHRSCRRWINRTTQTRILKPLIQACLGGGSGNTINKQLLGGGIAILLEAKGTSIARTLRTGLLAVLLGASSYERNKKLRTGLLASLLVARTLLVCAAPSYCSLQTWDTTDGRPTYVMDLPVAPQRRSQRDESHTQSLRRRCQL